MTEQLNFIENNNELNNSNSFDNPNNYNNSSKKPKKNEDFNFQELYNEIVDNYHDFNKIKSIILKYKDSPEILKKICQDIYIFDDGETEFNLLKICSFHYDTSVELLEIIIPYSNINFLDFDSSIFQSALCNCKLEVIKYIMDRINPNLLIFDYLSISILNSEINTNELFELFDKILELRTDIRLNDIHYQDQNLLYHFGQIKSFHNNDFYINLNDIFTYLIDNGVDINHNNGEALSSFLKHEKTKYDNDNFINSNPFSDDIILSKNIKLFLESGYSNVKRIYEEYLEYDDSDPKVVELIQSYLNKNTCNQCNTIYLTNECSICFEKYTDSNNNSTTENKQQIAIIPCGHTMCNGCYEQIKSTSKCPCCRANILHKINIK